MRNKQSDDELRQAISEKMQRTKAKGRGCLVVFFLIFFVAGTAMFFLLTVIPVAKAMSAGSWPTTTCVIVSSEVERHAGENGSTYRAKIVYDYLVHGIPHQSDRYNFTTFYSSGHKGKQEIVDRYPAGSEYNCYYNPNDPSQSVLAPGITPDMFIGSMGLIFMAVGLGGLLFALGFIGSRKSSDRRSGFSETIRREPLRGDRLDSMRVPEHAGEVTLESAGSPWVKVLFSLFFGLIWNGVVSVFLVMVVKSYVDGDPEICLTVFLIPFVVVGIGVILFFVHSLLAVFNPRPVITVSSNQVILGDTLEISWRFRGRTSSVRQLTVALEGSEHATYRRGTKTYTDTEEFANLSITDTTDPMKISSGNSSITIPAGTMHTFSAGHNRITWHVNVHGDIGFWPDVTESFEINVLPHNKAQVT